MPKDKILTEESRTKLDGIVQDMIKNKESDDNISFVVNDFKSKYAIDPVKKKPSEIWGSSSQPKTAYDTLVTDQAKQVGASVISAGKPKPKPKADGAEWTGGAGSFTIGINQEYKQRADKFHASTQLSNDDVEKQKQDVDSEWNNIGIWNNLKRYAGAAAKVATSMGSITNIVEGITGGAFTAMSKTPGSEFLNDQKIAKKQLLLEAEQAKKNGELPPVIDDNAIAERTKANVLDKRLTSLKESKERNYLIGAEKNVDDTGLSEKDKIERFDTQKLNTLKHTDRVELQKQNILRPAYEQSIKDLNASILKANNLVKDKQQIPQELANDILEKQNNLKQQEKDLQGSYNKFLDNRKELGSATQNLDVVKRDYAWGKKFLNTLGASSLELLSGVSAVPEYSANIMENIIGKNIFTKAVKEHSKWESDLYGDEALKLKEEISKPVNVDDIHGLSDFGDWFRNSLVASQLPILGTTLAGGWGIAAIGASSTGNAYKTMIKEMEEGKANYTPWQLAAIPAAHGGIDSVQAIVESNLLKGAGRTIASATTAEKQLIAEGFWKPIGDKLLPKLTKSIPHSNAWFAGITMSKNILAKYGEGKEDVHITDGLKDSFAMATAMGGLLPVLGHIGSEIVKPFSTDSRITNLSGKIVKLESELQVVGMDPIIRKEKQELLDTYNKNVSELLVKKIKDVKSLSNEQFTEVLDINKEQANLHNRAKDVKEFADPKDTESTQDILNGLKDKFKALEERRLSILQKGPGILLERLKDPEYIQELKDEAKKRLDKEAKAKGKTDVEFTDDEISREAITIHNEKVAIKKGYEDYNKRVAEEQAKPAEEKVWYYNEDAKRGPIESAPETLPEGYTSTKPISNSVELERWKNQTEVTPTEKIQGTPDVISEPIDLEVPKPKAEVKTEEEPLKHKENIHSKFKEQFKSKGIPEEQIDGAIALMEARAKSWASEEKGRTPEDWYQQIADVKGGEFTKDTKVLYQGIKSLFNKLKIDNNDISDIFDLVGSIDPANINRQYEYGKKLRDTPWANLEVKDFRDFFLKRIDNQIESIKGQIEKTNVIDKEGSISELRTNRKKKYLERIDRLKEVRDIIDENLLSTKDMSLNGNILYQVDAWHGSPYSFDKFTTEKMGTGEGNQSFGWGLYFTDVKDIAKKYQALTSKKQNFEIWIGDNTAEGLASEYYKRSDRASNSRLSIKFQDMANFYDVLAREFSYSKALEELRGSEELQKWAKENVLPYIKEDIGKLYNVTLHEGKSPSEYTWLEWDKPLDVDKIKSILEKDVDGSIAEALTHYYSENNDISTTKELIDTIYNEGTTGQELYRILSKNIGENPSDKEASMALLSAGIDGIKYPTDSFGLAFKETSKKGFNYVVFDENAVKINEKIQYQKEQGKPKGALETLEDGKVVIHALESPDFSTMAHEIAHIFEKDLTKEEKVVVDKFGGSEAFARGFEKYIREGKAPSAELKDLFEKFKTWMTEIYSKLKGSPIEKRISPEIKGIFDRLLVEKPTEKVKVAEEVKPTEVAEPTELKTDVEKGADLLDSMTEEQRDNFIDDWYEDRIPRGNLPGGNKSIMLYEARKIAPKQEGKIKRVTIDNSFYLSNEAGFVIKVDEEVYGLSKYEDPDAISDKQDSYGDPKEFVWAFTDLKTGETIETFESGVEGLVKEIKDNKKPVETKKEQLTKEVDEASEALKKAWNDIKSNKVGFAFDPNKKAEQDLKQQAAVNKALIDYGVAKLKKGVYDFTEFVEDLEKKGIKVSKKFAKEVYERIKNAHAAVSKKESGDRLGIKRTPKEEQAIQAKIDKAYELGAKEQKAISKEIEKALKLETKETEAQAKDALAAQKEVLDIEKAEALSEQGKKFKEQKESIKQSIKDKIEKSKDAIKNINQIVSESLPLDKLTKVQVKSILNNAMKIFTYVNVENGVANFVDHVDKVINNIDHLRNLENLETLRKKSFENLLKAKVDFSRGVTDVVSKVLSIKPEHIPSEVMSDYTRILDKLGDNADKRIQKLISEIPKAKGAELLKKQAELKELQENQIKDRAELIQMANNVVDAFQANRNKVIELSDEYNSYIENNNLQGEAFSKVVKKMEADDIITEAQADLMRSNSDYYVERKAREGKKGEVLEQRESLTDRVNQTLKSLNSPEGVEYRKNSLDRESILEADKVVGKVTKEYLDSLSDNELETVLNELNALDGGFVTANLRKIANGIDLFEREKAIKPILSDAKLKWWEGAKSKVKATYYGLKGDKVKSSVWYHKLQGAHNNIIDTVINNLQNNELYKNTSDKAAKLYGKNRTFISIKENEHVNPISNMIDKHFKGDSAEVMKSNIKTTMYLIQKAHESSMNKSKDLHIKDFVDTTNKNKVYDEKTLKEINLIFDKFKEKDFDADRWYNEELLDVERKAVDGISNAYKDPEILEKAKATSYFDNGRVLDTSNPNYYPVDFVFADNADVQIDNLIRKKTEAFYNPSMKAGSLMEKVGSSGGNNKSINLTNPFKTLETYITDVSTQYHLMNETRIQNQLYNKILKDSSLSKSALELVNSMKAGNDKVVKSWLENAYKETGFWGSIFDKRITKQLLSGFGKFAAEGVGNAINMVNHVGEVIDGIKIMNDSSLTTEQLDKVLYNIGIAQGERFIGKAISMDNSFKNQGDVNMPLSRKLKMDSNMPKEYINMMNNLYKRTKTKAALDQIEMLHDALRVTPDKSLSKPLILGIFNKRFQALSGEFPDWNKLSSGDAEYMSKNKEFIDTAASSSNVESSLVIGSQNPYEKAGKQVMTSDSGAYEKANSFFQGFSMAQGSAFQVALKNLLYNGTISKPEASLMIAQRVASQATYLAINKGIQKGLFTLAAGALGYAIFKDDEEEEGSIKRNIVSSAVQLAMSRTGAVGSNLAAFAFEKGSEQYGQGVLYEGEYTKGKATMFSAYDPKKTATENFMNVGMQSMGQRYVTISKGKEIVTDFQKGEWKTGMFDIAGNLGYVPLYKDINTITNNIKYQSIPSKESAKGMTSSQQSDLEKKTIPKAIENALYNLDMADIRFYRKEISQDQRDNIVKENTKVVESIAKVTGTVDKTVYDSARKKADERLKIRYSFYKDVESLRKMSANERVVYLVDVMKDIHKKGVISEDVDYELKQMIKTKLITKSEVDEASKIYNKYK